MKIFFDPPGAPGTLKEAVASIPMRPSRVITVIEHESSGEL
jgi:hypothetical protein